MANRPQVNLPKFKPSSNDYNQTGLKIHYDAQANKMASLASFLENKNDLTVQQVVKKEENVSTPIDSIKSYISSFFGGDDEKKGAYLYTYSEISNLCEPPPSRYENLPNKDAYQEIFCTKTYIPEASSISGLNPNDMVTGKFRNEAELADFIPLDSIGTLATQIEPEQGTSASDAVNNPLPLSSTDKVFTYNKLCKDSQIIIDLAARIGIPPAVMAAFRAVESGGNPAVIRFEPHLFNQNSNTKVPYTDSGKGYSLVASETNKSAFQRAFAINAKLAVESTSWGSYQVLGWSLLAIAETQGNPQKAVDLFYKEPDRISQEIVVSWFARNKDAVTYANNLDFANLARRYNGPGYAKGLYDVKIKQAYEKALTDCPEYSASESLPDIDEVAALAAQTAEQGEFSTASTYLGKISETVSEIPLVGRFFK